MSVYDEMYPVRGELSETKDCGVVALAAAGRLSYLDAHAALKQQGRQDRRCTYSSQIKKAARKLGMDCKEFYPRKKNGGYFTQRTIGKELKRGHYICYVRGHFFALVNGVVTDWSKDEVQRIKWVFSITKQLGENTMYYLVDHTKMSIVAAGEDDNALFELGTSKLTGDFKIMGDNIADWINTSPYKVDELKQMCENFTGKPCNRISNVEEGAYRVLSLAASANFKPLEGNKIMTKKTTAKAASKKVAKKVAKKVSPKKVASKKVTKKASTKSADGRPNPGTKTGQVWDIADSMKKATRAEVLAECEKKGINKSTASTQYQRWLHRAG